MTLPRPRCSSRRSWAPTATAKAAPSPTIKQVTPISRAARGTEQFPTTSGAFLRRQNAPTADVMAAFAPAINPAGNKLLYSTYLSGNTADAGTGIAVDKQGDAFVAGSIAHNLTMAVSADAVTFPLTKGAKYTTFNDIGDGFLTELNPRGTRILSSTLLGGLVPSGVALGSNGHAYLTGSLTQQDAKISEAKDIWFVVWVM